SHDVYSYTAGGAPWVVQSWLVSLAYAVAESLGGLTLVRAVVGLSAGAVAALAWALLRPVEALVVRLALAVLFLVVAAGSWAERPLMVGLVGFALVVLAGEGRLEARWLLPVGWIWLNSHGSFPLGVV